MKSTEHRAKLARTINLIAVLELACAALFMIATDRVHGEILETFCLGAFYVALIGGILLFSYALYLRGHTPPPRRQLGAELI